MSSFFSHLYVPQAKTKPPLPTVVIRVVVLLLFVAGPTRVLLLKGRRFLHHLADESVHFFLRQLSSSLLHRRYHLVDGLKLCIPFPRWRHYHGVFHTWNCT